MPGYTFLLPPVILLLVVVAGARRWRQRRELARERAASVDDDAVQQILRHGTLTIPEEEPLDEEEIARAEEEFWQESWEEPDEHGF